MDFFEAQERARRLSRGLVFLFLLAVVGMVAVVYLTVAVGLGFVPGGSLGLVGGGGGLPALDPRLLGIVSLGMGSVIGGGTAWRTLQLSRGGAAVAQLMGARPVPADTADPRERVLLNVVEEMSIASGLPVPQVFLMDGEEGINAFAAGHDPSDAAVAVTRGALERLSRDELQGVVAHEFSHILNGDMRLNVRLMGLLAGILLVSVVGRVLLQGSMRGRYRGSGRRGGPAQVALLGVVLVVLGYLGVIFGRLIQAAVSRQREFLADAAAVEFTRNPAGLAGALKRIGASADGSRVRDPHGVEAGHLLFASGARQALGRLTSTHPPLEERILKLDPLWDGRFPEEGAGDTPDLGPGTERGETVGSPAATGGAPAAVAMLAAAGRPGPAHLREARSVLAGLPSPARSATRTPEGAVAVVLALLLDEDPAVRSRQEEEIAGGMGGRAATAAGELRGPIREAGARARLPLLELALPSLRTLPRERAAALRTTALRLVGVDASLRPFEYAVVHLLRRAVPEAGGEETRRRRGSTTLERLADEAGVVLSALARTASGDEGAAVRSFDAAWAGAGFRGAGRLLAPAAVGLEEVDRALVRLETVHPDGRRRLLAGALAAIRADGRLEVEEVELFRALAEALQVPIPPLVADPGTEPGAPHPGEAPSGPGSGPALPDPLESPEP